MAVENPACYFCSHFIPDSQEGMLRLQQLRRNRDPYAPPRLSGICNASLNNGALTLNRGRFEPLQKPPQFTRSTLPTNAQRVCHVYDRNRQMYFTLPIEESTT